jgi:hypothetical protein
MKWYSKLSLAVFVCFLFYGCASWKKVTTRTVTTTVIRIDTIIKIQTDTILKIQSVTLHDTAIVENNSAIARSYFSVSKQRIVLELKGKTFDVPVSVYKKVEQVESKKEKEVIPKKNKFFWYMLGVITILIIYNRKELFK